MGQITVTFTYNDQEITQDLLDAQLIEPKLQGESNVNYVKRISWEHLKDLVKDGRIKRLQTAAANGSGDPNITYT